jgi:hypothetical protein
MMSDIEQKLRTKCEEIMNTYREEPIKEAFSTMIILLNNIINSPNDDNKRLFKKTNKAIQSKILIIKESLDLIKEIGYVDLDEHMMAYQGQDMTNLKTAVYVLKGYIEKCDKKLAEAEVAKDLARQEQVKRQNEEIERKFKEEKMRQLEIMKQLENDKRERSKKEKPTASVAKDLDYGAKVCKFEPKKDQQRG